MPSLSIDPFLDRMPGTQYNCLDFVREVWLALFKEDVTEKLTKLVGCFGNRKANLSGVKQFKSLDFPQSPCFVVMQRKGFTPHCGIYLNGRVLHLTDGGVQFQPEVIAKRYFKRVRYYR